MLAEVEETDAVRVFNRHNLLGNGDMAIHDAHLFRDLFVFMCGRFPWTRVDRENNVYAGTVRDDVKGGGGGVR